MKFDVKYGAGGKGGFIGKGTIHLYDTFMVLKGDMPKFRIPLINWFYHRMLCVPSTQTIPYSVISRHKSPPVFSLFYIFHHRITYQLPNGKKKTVLFKMRKPVRKNKQLFKTRLEEYMAIAKSFTVG